MKKCLVVGYGSIGRRHVDVLKSLGHDVSVVSRHMAEGDLEVYKDMRSAYCSKQFDYVVIAVETSAHACILKEFLQLADCKTVCLVEKPLLTSSEQYFDLGSAKVAVGYILRAHPLLRMAKDILKDHKLYSCRASCGQYLPDWRPGSDYRKCYSAEKNAGGGVLRDLSHELDYMQMLCGGWQRATAVGGKVSDLEINSEDQFGVLFETEHCPLCICHIDYLSRDVHRELFVEYDGGSLFLDFIKGTLLHNGKLTEVKMERNELFKTMHREVMEYDLTYFSGAADAVDVLKLIEAAELAAGEGVWIKKK